VGRRPQDRRNGTEFEFRVEGFGETGVINSVAKDFQFVFWVVVAV